MTTYLFRGACGVLVFRFKTQPERDMTSRYDVEMSLNDDETSRGYADNIHVIGEDNIPKQHTTELQFRGMRQSRKERTLDLAFKGIISAACLALVFIGAASVMTACPTCQTCPPLPAGAEPPVIVDYDPTPFPSPPAPVPVVSNTNVPRPPRARIPVSP